jgi:hypothetical protein
MHIVAKTFKWTEKSLCARGLRCGRSAPRTVGDVTRALWPRVLGALALISSGCSLSIDRTELVGSYRVTYPFGQGPEIVAIPLDGKHPRNPGRARFRLRRESDTGAAGGDNGRRAPLSRSGSSPSATLRNAGPALSEMRPPAQYGCGVHIRNTAAPTLPTSHSKGSRGTDAFGGRRRIVENSYHASWWAIGIRSLALKPGVDAAARVGD